MPVGTWAALRRGTWLDPLHNWRLRAIRLGPGPGRDSVPAVAIRCQAGLASGGGWQTREILGVEIGSFRRRPSCRSWSSRWSSVAGLARYMRAQVLDVLDQDFVRTARAKGPERAASRHAGTWCATRFCRSSRSSASSLPALIAGSIIVETLLGIPGIGQYTFESIGTRDYDSIMAVVLLGALVFQLAMLAVDIAYGFIDPRIRLSAAGRT